MSDLKHTPGPWTMWYKNDCDYIILGPQMQDGNPEIAHVNGYIEFSDAENKANAKLIAAAPDMLQTLIDLKASLVEDGYYSSDEEIQAIDAILEKVL
jgi:hypothetical protein